MYTIMRELLDRFYPERQVTVTSADPRYITPAVKAIALSTIAYVAKIG